MRGLLLAGGHGTRLRPLTFTGNKHTLPIANKPMILYGLEHLVNAGIKEIGVILGPIKEGLVGLLGDGSKYGANITYIDQPEPRGLAHAVLTAKNFLQNEEFVMYLGDNLLKEGVKPLIQAFYEKNSDCAIGISHVQNPQQFGVVVLDDRGRVTKLVEKPKEAISNWALVGIYVFNKKIIDAASEIQPSWRNEYEITDAIQHLLEKNAHIETRVLDGWWKDTGKPSDLLEANQLILHDLISESKANSTQGTIIQGSIKVGDGTTLENSVVRGPALIGRNCKIGPNVFIGPYTSIGDNVTLSNCEVENIIIMNDVRITTSKRLVDSIVGRGTIIQDAEDTRPTGVKLVVGDSSTLQI